MTNREFVLWLRAYTNTHPGSPELADVEVIKAVLASVLDEDTLPLAATEKPIAFRESACPPPGFS